MYMWCQMRSMSNGLLPIRLPARSWIRSGEPPSPMPVMPISVSTVTSMALWLNDRFMLGCDQHFTRVILALGSAASARVAGSSAAPAPAARALRSDLRLIMEPAFRVKVWRTSYHAGSSFIMRDISRVCGALRGAQRGACMRKVWIIGFLLLLTGIPAIAQETRSTIAGTVRDEQGIIPGATVKVTNVGTGVTQTLTTNGSGYFEARLLIAGDYDVLIEMVGFKTLRRSGITLGSGQQLDLQLALEIGTIAEEITVTGEAALIETTTLRQGLVLDEKKIAELPVQSNMPLLLARFAPGMSARGVIPFAGQGFVGGPTTNAIPLGNVGGVDWSIDGASNNGVGRQMSTSPNTDMLQEMRVESTNFTASIGHGTGVGI